MRVRLPLRVPRLLEVRVLLWTPGKRDRVAYRARLESEWALTAPQKFESSRFRKRLVLSALASYPQWMGAGLQNRCIWFDPITMLNIDSMLAVAQLVERLDVAQAVRDSSSLGQTIRGILLSCQVQA